MLEPLRWLPFLLIPVLALLFLNLRLSRKLRYPHDLLVSDDRRGMASLLFRSFRSHYDVALDALIAAALVFALLPPERPRRSAVVIDGSRSMMGGFAENRPLVKAIKRIQSDPVLKNAEPFALVFNPKHARTELVPIRPFLESDSEATLRHLRENLDWFTPDYQTLAELRERGFGEINLLTDQARIKPVGFQTVELGFAVNFAAYPTSVRFDRPSGSWLVTLAESGERASIRIAQWDRDEQAFAPLTSGRFSIEEGTAGRVIRFPAPGLYLVSLKGPYGLDDIDLPLLLPPRMLFAQAIGSFSSRMLSIFPDVDRHSSPSLLLADWGSKTLKGIPALTTVISKDSGMFVMDPARADGALVAAGSMPGADFVWGPSSLSNEDLVLAYDACLSRKPPAFVSRVPGNAKILLPVGSSFMISSGAGLLPLLPPASQFFEERPQERVILPPPVSSRWPWVLLLGSLSGLKLILWKRLTGKNLMARD